MEKLTASVGEITFTPSLTEEPQPTQGAVAFNGRKVTKVKDSDFSEFPTILKFSSNAKKAMKTKLDTAEVFAVTEKLNGKCYSYYTRGGDVRIASRKAIIAEDKDLDDSKIHIGHYCENIKTLYQKCCEEGHCDSGELVVVTGEYYGPDVKLGVGTTPYPSNNFAAFSIAANEKLLDYDTYRKLALQSGIPVVPEILQGSLDDAIAVDPNNRISDFSGAAQVPILAEGIVIQTKSNRMIKFAPHQPEQLAIFKLKAEGFKEEEHKTRVKGKETRKGREKAGLSKGEQAYPHELAQALIPKLQDNPPGLKGIGNRIIGLISKQMIDLSQQRSLEFYDEIRRAAINDAMEEVKLELEQDSGNLSEELKIVLDTDYRKQMLMNMLNRKVNRSKLPDKRIEEILRRRDEL